MISLYDMDKTVLKVNGSAAFGKYLFQQKAISFFTFFYAIGVYVLGLLGFFSIETMHKKIFHQLFYKRSLKDFSRHLNQFLDSHWQDLINPPIIKELQKDLYQGNFVAILSSSPDFLVKEVASRLNIPDWKATLYQVDAGGYFSKISACLLGKDKAEYLHKTAQSRGVPISLVKAYSDSFLDWEFLSAAGIPIAVNPDRKLRKLSIANNWKII